MMLLAALLLAFAAPAEAAPSRLLVEATEFRYTLSRTTVRPGPAIVQLVVRGEDPHDLRLVRGKRWIRLRETLPGGMSEWRGKLTRGRWVLYCSLAGHKRAGMRSVLRVLPP